MPSNEGHQHSTHRSRTERRRRQSKRNILQCIESNEGQGFLDGTDTTRQTEISGIDDLKHSTSQYGIVLDNPYQLSWITIDVISKGEHPFADIVHIGDTRCYFETSDNQYRCETDDHTIAGDLCRQGHIEYHEISKADGNNVLTRFLGDCKNTKIQFKSSKDVPNTAVLCSDGVWGVLHDENGLTIPPHENSNMAVELVQNAIIGGSSDNCTAVVVHTGVI